MAISIVSSVSWVTPFKHVLSVTSQHNSNPPTNTHSAIHTHPLTRVSKREEEGGPHTAGFEANDSVKINEFIEIGVIRSTHGIHGELKIAPSTDFPEERLGKPGIRWVQTHRQGMTKIRQVELTKGRRMHGKQPSWLVTFGGVDDPEKASEFIGNTVLISASDRPILNDDEFYIPDLVGMSVVLQKSGEAIGEIADVFRTGANDLLRVKMLSFDNTGEAAQKQRDSEPFAWIPFVADIVPTVDRNRRIVEINPPKGLLELYMSKRVSKEESHKQAVKERRRLQEKVSGIKKRLVALKQDQLLSVLSSDKKIKKDALLQQLMGIDFKLFQHALQSACMANTRFVAKELSLPFLPTIPRVDREGLEEWINKSDRPVGSDSSVDACSLHWWKTGLQLIGENKVAVLALPAMNLEDSLGYDYRSNLKNQAEQLLFIQTQVELSSPGKKPQIPWIVITTDAFEEVVKELFKNENFFGLDEKQVILLKQSFLPYIDFHHDIIMEPSGKILTGSTGEGQVFYDLAMSGNLTNLMDQGIYYIQMYTLENSLAKVADPIAFGFTHEKQASIGMKVVPSAHREKVTQILCLQEPVSESDLKHKGKRHYVVMKHENLPTEVLCNLEESRNSMLTTDPMTLDKLQHTQLRRLFYGVSRFSDNIYSIKYLQYLASQVYRLQYDATLKNIPHMQKVENHLTQSGSNEYNVMQLGCSIHNALALCKPEEVALLEDI